MRIPGKGDYRETERECYLIEGGLGSGARGCERLA